MNVSALKLRGKKNKMLIKNGGTQKKQLTKSTQIPLQNLSYYPKPDVAYHEFVVS